MARELRRIIFLGLKTPRNFLVFSPLLCRTPILYPLFAEAFSFANFLSWYKKGMKRNAAFAFIESYIRWRRAIS